MRATIAPILPVPTTPDRFAVQDRSRAGRRARSCRRARGCRRGGSCGSAPGSGRWRTRPRHAASRPARGPRECRARAAASRSTWLKPAHRRATNRVPPAASSCSTAAVSGVVHERADRRKPAGQHAPFPASSRGSKKTSSCPAAAAAGGQVLAVVGLGAEDGNSHRVAPG